MSPSKGCVAAMHAAGSGRPGSGPGMDGSQESRWRKQNFQICAPRLTSTKKPLAAQIGGSRVTAAEQP